MNGKEKIDNKDANKQHKLKLRPANPVLKGGHISWTVKITIVTFVLSVALTYIQGAAFKGLSAIWAFVVLGLVIFIGILLDIIGIAATAAEEAPFHAIASRKVETAKYAVILIRNAEKVSNFCSDVVGDISGILVGTMIAAIVIALSGGGEDNIIISLLITGTVAGVTVGGKALGKTFAIAKANIIIYYTAAVIRRFDVFLGKKRELKKKK